MEDPREHHKEEKGFIESAVFGCYPPSFFPHPLCFPWLTTGQQASQVDEVISLKSEPSMSAQASLTKSKSEKSVGSSSEGGEFRL